MISNRPCLICQTAVQRQPVEFRMHIVVVLSNESRPKGFSSKIAAMFTYFFAAQIPTIR